MFHILALLAAATLIVGCAARPDLAPRPIDDPANPHAPESPATSIAIPLTIDAPPAVTSEADPQNRGEGAIHTTQPTAGHVLYTCKMHPKVVSDHPGNCPICGMKLVAKAGAK